MAINPRELRIGNLVYGPLGEIMVIDQIGSKDYIHATCLDNSGSGQNGLSPIPLTEERLVRLRFSFLSNKNGHLYYVSVNGFTILYSYGKWHWSSSPSITNGREIKYVHHLQNLCFDLAGEELDFSDVS